MINAYEGVMDTNLVLPLGVDKCAVVFDYYFADTSKKALKKNLASIKVSEKVQDEDEAICDAVQRGLASRAYVAGGLSVRREAGGKFFLRLVVPGPSKPPTPRPAGALPKGRAPR